MIIYVGHGVVDRVHTGLWYRYLEMIEFVSIEV